MPRHARYTLLPALLLPPRFRHDAIVMLALFCMLSLSVFRLRLPLKHAISPLELFRAADATPHVY